MKRLVLTILFTHCLLLLIGQNPEWYHFPVDSRSWNVVETDDFFFVQGIYSITQFDKDLNTVEMYDGYLSNLPGHTFYSITKDQQDRPWVGCRGGLAYFEDGEWVSFDTTNSILPYSNYFYLHGDQHGNIWTASNNILYKYDGTTWSSIEDTSSVYWSPRTIDSDSQGNLWISSSAGLIKFDGSNFNLFPTNHIYTMAVSHDDKVWFSIMDSIVSFDGNTFTKYSSSQNGFPCAFAEDMTFDSENNLWIAVRAYGLGPNCIHHGVVKFDGQNWTYMNSGNSSYQGSDPEAIFIDSEDFLWITCDQTDNSLWRGKGTDFNPVRVRDYLLGPDFYVWAAPMSSNGETFFIGADSLCQIGTDWKWEFRPFIDSLSSLITYPKAISSNSQGTIYGITNNSYPPDLLFEMKNDSVSILDTKYNLHALAVDEQDNIWYWASDYMNPVTLYVKDGNNLSTYPGWPSAPKSSLITFDDDKCWVIINQQIGMFEAGNMTYYDPRPGYTYQGIVKDPKGKILVSYFKYNSQSIIDFGILEFDNGTWTDLSGAPQISKMAFDSEGALWGFSLQGLLTKFKDGQVEYFSYDGKNVGPSPNIHIDGADRIWVKSQNGLFVFAENGLNFPTSNDHFCSGELLNYPNPFSSETNICFDLDLDQVVDIKVFDVRGRLVRSYESLQYQAGHNAFTIQMEDVESGIYYFRVDGDEVIGTGKMVKLRDR